jgi:hypothetical protein
MWTYVTYSLRVKTAPNFARPVGSKWKVVGSHFPLGSPKTPDLSKICERHFPKPPFDFPHGKLKTAAKLRIRKNSRGQLKSKNFVDILSTGAATF